ncbi:hypothetical protein UT300012_21960 [Paraclostridium bifermentans]
MKDKIEVKIIPMGNNEYICSKEAEPETLELLKSIFDEAEEHVGIVSRILLDDDAYAQYLAVQLSKEKIYSLDLGVLDTADELANELALMVDEIETRFRINEESEKVYHNIENTNIKHTPEQMEEIMKGVKAGIDVFSYADVGNTPEQMREIRESLMKDSLDD